MNTEKEKQLLEQIRVKSTELNALCQQAARSGIFVDLEIRYYFEDKQNVETRLVSIKGMYREI